MGTKWCPSAPWVRGQINTVHRPIWRPPICEHNPICGHLIFKNKVVFESTNWSNFFKLKKIGIMPILVFSTIIDDDFKILKIDADNFLVFLTTVISCYCIVIFSIFMLESEKFIMRWSKMSHLLSSSSESSLSSTQNC